jgi:hypothetical protein
MKTETRSREYREGWLGRRRTYKCIICTDKFQEDRCGPLPKRERICPYCRNNTVLRIPHLMAGLKLQEDDHLVHLCHGAEVIATFSAMGNDRVIRLTADAFLQKKAAEQIKEA